MRKPMPRNLLMRKMLVLHLRLLQAENVGLIGCQEPRDQILADAD